jgi:hypothetical protein
LRATHPADWETAAFLPDFLLENPLLGRRAQLLLTLLAPRLGIRPHHWLGPGKPIAYTRAIIENQLQPVLADNFADLYPQNSRGSDLNFSVNFSFTSGVKRKFSR